MTYATVQDLRRRFGDVDMDSLSDPDNTGLASDAVLQAALDDADEEINGYVAAAGYALPIPSPIPSSIKYAAADIAHYRLYRAVAPEQVTAKYEYDLKWLRDVAKGAVKLVDATGRELPRASVGAGGAVSGRPATAPVVHAVFNPATLGRFVDPRQSNDFGPLNPFERAL